MCQADDGVTGEDGVAPEGALHPGDGEDAGEHRDDFIRRLDELAYGQDTDYVTLAIDDLRRILELGRSLTVLSPEQWDAFTAALGDPPGPNEKLKEMMRDYKAVKAAQREAAIRKYFANEAEVFASTTGAAAATMQRGNAYWTYDHDAGAWYFGLESRAKPPYLTQKRFEAIVDLDAQGRLAGIELLEALEPSENTDV